MTAYLQVKMPDAPIFVGSYLGLEITFDPAQIDYEDLEFRTPDDLASGFVSPSVDPSQGMPGTHTVMLLAGYRPGMHQLRVFSKSTGQVLFEHEFELTTSWSDDHIGPSRWITGELGASPQAAAWGGGPADPQNMNTYPASGTHRVAVVLVDTATQRFSTDNAVLDDLRNHWITEALGVSPPNGNVPGASRYFREVSYGNFDLSVEVFGPVSLTDEFDAYIHDNGLTKGHYFQAVITAADEIVDYNSFDSVVCALRSVDGAGPIPLHSAHGQASLGKSGPYATSNGDVAIGMVSMPHAAVPGSGPLHTTLAHELGHNLHMRDQRTGPRQITSWDLMANDGPLPHLTVAHRMMLGWVDASWIRTFNFESEALPVDELVRLAPIQLGAPGPGRALAIEIRLADGWNYYFEYRVTQDDQIGDQAIEENRAVFVTDVLSEPNDAPIVRSQILRAPSIGASDGAVLSAGEAFEQNDTSTPNFPVTLRVSVESEDGQSAVLRVQYAVLDKPDPSIRPWPAGPGRRYQSPDIEIQNARNLADPNWFNTPWVGEFNEIVARIKNGGSAMAPNVEADFYVKDLNGGGGPETFLGTDIKDVPGGSTVEFKALWTPPSDGHYCVVVRIPLYQTPGPNSQVEFTELNNFAQSNYDRFISDTASPAQRVKTTLAIGNPYDLPTRITIVPQTTNPLYRTYLGNQWVSLRPGEVRHIEIMFEYADAVIEEGKLITDREYLDSLIFHRFSNDVSFSAFIDDPKDESGHITHHLGGADIRIATGRKTQFSRFDLAGSHVSGAVVESATGTSVSSGSIILMMTTNDGRSYRPVTLADGQFKTVVRDSLKKIQAYYLPGRNYGESYSDILENQV